MQDFSLPGMLHGRVVRPSGFGATLISYDEASIAHIPGIVKVVRINNFLGVVAETEWSAIKAAQQLAVTWSKWEGLPAEDKLYEHVRATKINKDDVTSNIGNVREALQQGTKTLKATYDFAIHTHGSIGPSCAIAEIKNGQLTCWTASQVTHDLRMQLAEMLAVADADVRCIYVEGAGCYGRNGHEDAAGDAALLSRSGQAGARAMDAGRRTWLGSQRAADAARYARRDRSGRQCRRLGIGIVHTGWRPYLRGAGRLRSCQARQSRQAQPRQGSTDLAIPTAFQM
jgi:CO/xanthine dehydrogenase Mo-binding subunit